MKYKSLFDIIFDDRGHEISSEEKNAAFWGSLFFVLISAVLSILNIQKRY